MANFILNGKVYGSDSGGGSGTTVIANPSGTATDTLIKLQVDNDIYSVSGGGGASSLAQLSDVNISNLQNGQSLVWNATTQKWENKMVSGGGGDKLEADYGAYKISGYGIYNMEGIINGS